MSIPQNIFRKSLVLDFVLSDLWQYPSTPNAKNETLKIIKRPSHFASFSLFNARKWETHRDQPKLQTKLLYFTIHRNFIGSMPIYKLHEAPRAEPSFSNQHAANLPPVRVPLQSQVTPVPVPSSVPSSAAATMSSTAANAVQENSPPINPPSLETAHSGHSLYFVDHLFPSKLWHIVNDAERGGYDNIISWVDDGMAFQIREYNIVR